MWTAKNIVITDNTILDFVGTERKCETSIHVHTLLEKHHILDLVATERKYETSSHVHTLLQKHHRISADSWTKLWYVPYYMKQSLLNHFLTCLMLLWDASLSVQAFLSLHLSLWACSSSSQWYAATSCFLPIAVLAPSRMTTWPS